MSNLAIRVDNLGKRYYIGQSRNVGSLAESIGNFVTRSLGRSSSETHASRTTHKPFWALRDVSFELEHGGSLGLIGRNGSGKSTLLKILARITRPTEGSLEVRGRLRSLLEVGVGFHPELTGMENIFLNGSIMGMKRAQIRQKLDEIIDFSGVERFIETPVKYYSSGMYLRLAFSVSIHLEPDILLVDEVLAVGDMEFQQKCLKKLAQLREQGQTILLVSHSPDQVLSICTQVLWLDRGQVVTQGSPAKVVGEYVREQTSGHLSPINSDQSESESITVARSVESQEVKSTPEGEAFYEPPLGANGMQLIRAYVTDETLCMSPEIRYESPFYFVCEYHVDQPLRRVRFGFKLINDAHQEVLLSMTTDSVPDGDERFGKPGRHRVMAKLPGNWFKPGKYSVTVGASSGTGTLHFLENEAFTMSIGGITFEAIGPEVLHPVLDWQIAPIP